MNILKTFVPITAGLAIGVGCFFGGMHAVKNVSPVIDVETGQTAYVDFGTGGHGFVTPGQLQVYKLGKYGIWVGFAVTMIGAQGFRKKPEAQSS